MKRKNIGLLVGSLRKDSFSKKAAQAICALMPESIKIKPIEIGHLPLYNQDFDDNGLLPESYEDFRREVKELDGVMIITPEYNRSYPAVLKNALDIASRPPADNAWSGKPGAVISVSPGKLGAFGANHHLRQVLVCLNIYAMPQPEAYIGGIDNLLDKDGKTKEESTEEFFQRIADQFVSWVNRFE